jgi:hypothetical protein
MYAFYEPESRYDIFGTPGFTLFITRDWEFINLRITSWNSGPHRGAKHINGFSEEDIHANPGETKSGRGLGFI